MNLCQEVGGGVGTRVSSFHSLTIIALQERRDFLPPPLTYLFVPIHWEGTAVPS